MDRRKVLVLLVVLGCFVWLISVAADPHHIGHRHHNGHGHRRLGVAGYNKEVGDSLEIFASIFSLRFTLPVN